MTTIAEKLVALNNIKTELKEAINSKGVVVEDTTPFNQYPSKIGQIGQIGQVGPHLFNSNTYACSIDGSEIDTEDKKHAVIMQHRSDAMGTGKTEIFIVFKGEIPSGIFNECFNSIFNELIDIQKVSIIFDSQANIPAALNGYSLFCYCTSLTSIPRLDTSNVTDMAWMFYSCTSLTTIPRLDTSNVTGMEYMFYNCTSLTSIPRLDTSNVTGMGGMFNDCTSLTTIPQLDTSNVTDMEDMFYYCTSLTTIPALDTSNVTNMHGMFGECTSLKNIDMFGMNTAFSVAGTKLGTEALNKLFTNLATVIIGQSINITGTPGASTCDRSIAIAKGWSVVG